MKGKARPASGGRLNQLKEIVDNAGIHLNPPVDTGKTPLRNSEISRPKPQESSVAPTDEAFFSEAMEGVERVSWNRKPNPSSMPVHPPGPDPGIEERKMMQEAMEQGTPIPIPEHPEYVEGWVGVAGKRFIPDLRNGIYSIQGQIDLHGMNHEEAQAAVEAYIVRMSRFRSCCVKIIHGRGINSPTDRAILKDMLPRLLSTRKMSRYVVAYASAPSRDGGVGSLYVLLRSRHH